MNEVFTTKARIKRLEDRVAALEKAMQPPDRGVLGNIERHEKTVPIAPPRQPLNYPNSE